MEYSNLTLCCCRAMALLLGCKLLSLFVLSLILIMVSPSLSDPLYQVCGSTKYTASSTYESNLLALLPSLIYKASNQGFYTDTVGIVPDLVYALSFCRGDTNTSVCRSCLDIARQDAHQLCAYNKAAFIGYNYCFLRYSNQDILNSTDNSVVLLMQTTQNVTDPDRFNKLAAELVNRTSQYASFNSFQRFGTGEADFTAAVPKLYGMAQCTRDFSGDKCYNCLSAMFPVMQNFSGKRGGRVLGSRCYFRYEDLKFYEGESMVHIPSSSSSPPQSNGNPTPAVPTVGGDGSSDPTTTIVLSIVLPVIGSVILISTIYLYFQRRRTAKKMVFFPEIEDEAVFESGESRLFDLNDLKEATDNFSDANMLGEGGFGPVYKGALKDGQEIAVKKLSRTSGQGMFELRNEVVFVAKLQHRNLVKLLGCCLEKEKLLVYEYLPNTSLDNFLFDPIKVQQLDWSRRYKIIQGISKGLLYLHEDSRLRIIHRDLKASNILLDGDMNPKISDFGLAKHFGVNETHGKTNRIAGTYGYMAPEYAIHGEFSTKSDAFSYGVLILEIVTGQKNGGFQRGSNPADNLLSHVWKHWNEGRALELRDQSLSNRFIEEQMLRCIHIGLLCVQEDPTKRPNMALVVHMLSSDSSPLPTPSTPAFLNLSSMLKSDELPRDVCLDLESSEHNSEYTGNPRMISVNGVSISQMEPR